MKFLSPTFFDSFYLSTSALSSRSRPNQSNESTKSIEMKIIELIAVFSLSQREFESVKFKLFNS